MTQLGFVLIAFSGGAFIGRWLGRKERKQLRRDLNVQALLSREVGA